MERIGKWAKTAGYILTIAALVFIFKTLFSLNIDFSRIAGVGNFILVGLLSVAVYTASVFVMAYGWQKLLIYIAGADAGYLDVSRAYVKANIAKYLPGNFMHYAGRNLLGARYGFSQLDIAFSTLAEIVLQALSALVLALLLSGGQLFGILRGRIINLGSGTIIAVAVLVAAGLIAGTLVIRRNMDRFQKYKLFFTRTFWRFALKIAPLYMGVLLVTGGVLAMTLAVVLQSGAAHLAVAWTAYIIAWLIGFMVPGAPGGIGVREAILYVLLAPVFGMEITMMAALIQRLFSIAGDVLAFVIQMVMGRIKRESDAQTGK